MTYHKILNETLTHHGFRFKEGLNVDTVPFNPEGKCRAGGLYFTDKNNIHEFISYGTLMADVTLPSNAHVYQEVNKWKADQIILSNIRTIPLEIYVKAIQRSGCFLRYVPRAFRTPELCLKAVKQDGYALKHVPRTLRTPELCLKAVSRCGCSVEFVPPALQTPELCLVAVKQNGRALKHLPLSLQTPELCLESNHL